MALKFALVDNHLTPDPDDYMAQVQGMESKTQEDIINLMISRGSTVTKAEAMSVLEEYALAVEQILKAGEGVNTELFKINPAISGVFEEEESFDRNRHQVKLNVSAGSRLKKLTQEISVEKVEATKPAPFLSSFTDVATNSKNEHLSPGLVGHIRGRRLKIDISNPQEGVFLVAEEGTEYPASALVRNMPSEIIFMIPGELPAGEYNLEVRSNMRSSELRTGRLEENLVVNPIS
ncbi:DNA-binding domain-containing protein [Xanthovirga aplysinae]|uniref:DNA-binding domain-containing protein n=1 Tax=Xanthovirga aplysinae TaxID=2529853 RepID=UPI0012BC22A3|nr:DNA-binding domain-containing protein [Xanthovirga aplysinae]MTI33258.1 DUF4469 domain-containing protein [Xanthovirga aplysinae]